MPTSVAANPCETLSHVRLHRRISPRLRAIAGFGACAVALLLVCGFLLPAGAQTVSDPSAAPSTSLPAPTTPTTPPAPAPDPLLVQAVNTAVELSRFEAQLTQVSSELQGLQAQLDSIDSALQELNTQVADTRQQLSDALGAASSPGRGDVQNGGEHDCAGSLDRSQRRPRDSSPVCGRRVCGRHRGCGSPRRIGNATPEQPRRGRQYRAHTASQARRAQHTARQDRCASNE